MKTFYIFLALLTISCSSSKLNPLQYDGASILFGEGGGISGIENSQLITDDGRLYTIGKMRTSHEYIKRIRQQEAEQLFASLDVLNIESIKLNSPGNTYKFIEIKKNNTEYKFVWSGDSPYDQLNILYRILKTKAQ